MPADRTLGEGLADALVRLYGAAQERIVVELTRRLRAWLDSSGTASEGSWRRRLSELTEQLHGAMVPTVYRMVDSAYVRGGKEALRDLSALDVTGRHVDMATLGGQARDRLARSLVERLGGTHLQITRWAVDAYRDVIAAHGAVPVLSGEMARRQASERAWRGLLQRGVTGFTDAAGRRWNLASYVEMAARTTVTQAATEGHLDKLSAVGIDLVIVSNAPHECVRCRPWEGKVLARGGPGGERTIEAQHATDDRPVSVRVAGTVDEAIRAGLHHPQCRHTLSAYLPGLTQVPRHTADPAGDAARQQLRAMERRVRAARLVQAGALSRQGRADAARRVAALQGRIREHVKANAELGIFRKLERERPNLGNKP